METEPLTRLQSWVRGYGIVAVASSLIFFVLATAVVLRADGLLNLDTRVADHFAKAVAQHSPWIDLWSAIGMVMSPVGSYIVAAIALAWLWRVRNAAGAGSAERLLIGADFKFIAVGIGGGAVITYGTKLIAGRERPAGAAIEPFGLSFPSGHASAIAVLAFVALFVVHRHWPQVPLVASLTLAVLLPLVTAYSRLALAVHFVSDVAAGLFLGLAWCGLSAWWCYRRLIQVQV